eukprot:g10089.t1
MMLARSAHIKIISCQHHLISTSYLISCAIVGNAAINIISYQHHFMSTSPHIMCDHCGKSKRMDVLTLDINDNTYKVWDLATYELLYEIRDKQIEEIKVSPGVMLVIYKRPEGGGHIPLRLLSIATGEVLKTFARMVHRSRNV